MEFNSSKSVLNLSVPLPDGTTETFGVVRTQILAPQIAEQNPSIKTYTGTTKNRGGLTINFTLSNNGFDAIVLGDDNSFYVEKLNRNDENSAYLFYFVKDAFYPKGFTRPHTGCGQLESNHENDAVNKMAVNLNSNSTARTNGLPLRTFRIAITTTTEYTTLHGGQASTLAFVTAQINRMSAVFKRDLAVTFSLVSGTNTILTSANANLPNGNQGDCLQNNTAFLDGVIGNNNYDVGHILTFDGVGTSGGGVAYSPGICGTSKGGGVSGEGGSPWTQITFDQTLFHEVGHQFGMSHSYNSNGLGTCTTRSQPTSVEPGSGATIMS